MKKNTLFISAVMAISLVLTACSSSRVDDPIDTATVEPVEEAPIEPEPEPEPEPVTITITAAGDCSIGKLSIHGYYGSLNQYFDENGPEYFFDGVKDVFSNDDMTIVNFEGVLTESETIVEKQYNIKGRPEYISVLPVSSIEAVSFGNNHREDYGRVSLEDTVALFEQENITYAYEDVVGMYEVKDKVIGIVSVNEVYDGVDKTKELLLAGIEELKANNCDLIICCPHWGIEGNHKIENYQQEIAYLCIDNGADLVLGCHPHVLQGMECYKDKMILYSMGNFCFGGNMNPKDKQTMIFQQTFTFDPAGDLVTDLDAKVIPCTLSSVDNKNDYQPTIRDGEKGQAILDNLNLYSQDFNIVLDEEGKVSTVQKD